MSVQNETANYRIEPPLSVEFTPDVAEAMRNGMALQKLRPAHTSYLSYAYVPAGLGVLLMIWAGLSGVKDAASFLPLLATGTVAYLSGYYALVYEIKRAWRQSVAAAYDADPAYRQPWRITLDVEAIEISSRRSVGRVLYSGLRKADVADGMIVYWAGSEPEFLAPVRAFATRQSACAFADEINRRIEASKRQQA